MIQGSLFRTPSVDVSGLAALVELQDGNAMLIDWSDESHDPTASIDAAVEGFERLGWVWDGYELRKDGKYVWFRSQGSFARPILQWGRIKTKC